jgi:hypothetical protein
MRIVTGLIPILLVASAWSAGPAGSGERRYKIDPQLEIRLMELEGRARQLFPRRRDTPLRALNMTGEEVREVETIAAKYHMPELVNISPVVTGCPCEEGGSCTEQVFITSRVNGSMVSLQLSRRKNLWTVGLVQKWWLEYAALKERERSIPWTEFQDARAQLLLNLPMCTRPPKLDTPATQVAETKTAK